MKTTERYVPVHSVDQEPKRYHAFESIEDVEKPSELIQVEAKQPSSYPKHNQEDFISSKYDAQPLADGQPDMHEGLSDLPLLPESLPDSEASTTRKLVEKTNKSSARTKAELVLISSGQNSVQNDLHTDDVGQLEGRVEGSDVIAISYWHEIGGRS